MELSDLTVTQKYMGLLGETPVNSFFNRASVTMVKRNHRWFGDFILRS